MDDPTPNPASSSAPADPRPALLGLAQSLADRLSALPEEALGSPHSLRLARALSLDVVNLLGTTTARHPQ